MKENVYVSWQIGKIYLLISRNSVKYSINGARYGYNFITHSHKQEGKMVCGMLPSLRYSHAGMN
jgi:hypothetical protein